MVADDDIIAAHDIIVAMDALRLKGVHHFGDRGEFRRIAGFKPYLFAGDEVYAVMEHKLQAFEGIQIARGRAAVRGSAAWMRFHASDDGPVARLFEASALIYHHRDDDLVAEEGRICLSVLVHLHAEINKRLRCLVTDADADSRRVQLDAVGCLQREI
ncbi:hypothetical protein SDC9_174668 [bioreactor metagenome]|uniref:Uncharacterized protein n=1 Tax=bioreactor metagenome TaxID=1076179 RepID=A0A645GM45_9ZZZZ